MRLELFAHPGESVLAQALEIDSFFPINTHHTRCRGGRNWEIAHDVPSLHSTLREIRKRLYSAKSGFFESTLTTVARPFSAGEPDETEPTVPPTL